MLSATFCDELDDRSEWLLFACCASRGEASVDLAGPGTVRVWEFGGVGAEVVSVLFPRPFSFARLS